MESESKEPMLKYSKFYSSKIELSENSQEKTITALAITDRFIAIGSNSGNILLLDAQGNTIKEWIDRHSMKINHIEIDSTREFIASASQDGTVIISSLYNYNDKTIHHFKQPILALALEPDFGKKTSRQFVCGGPAGSLLLTGKGWFAQSQSILHSGQGTITSISWNGSFIAWANDISVTFLDTVTSTRIGQIEKSPDLSKGDMYRCNICWIHRTRTLIGWARSVKVVDIKVKTATEAACIQILHQFDLDIIVSGIAPLDSTIIILGNEIRAADLVDQNSNQESKETTLVKKPPELRIVNYTGIEIANDTLSLSGHESCLPPHYRLGHICLDQDSDLSGRSSSDYVFYISSPRDVLVAKPRDVKDHVIWLTESGRFQSALELIEKSVKEYTTREKEESVLEIGQKLLEKWMTEEQFEKAAEWLVRIIGMSHEEIWEKWVLRFAESHQTKTIAYYIPTRNPKLSFSLYELVLNEFMQTDLDGFHKLIHKWPIDIYNGRNVIQSLEVVLDSAKQDKEKQLKLYDILSDLCALDKQIDRSIYYSILADKPGQAERLESENMFSLLKSNVLLVMKYALSQCQKEIASTLVDDPYEINRACARSKFLQILVTNTDLVSVSFCVTELSLHPQLQHIYLDSLFTLVGDTHENGKLFQDRQIELFIKYDPERVLDYLRTASCFSYPKAYQLCSAKEMIPEMLYLLGKMGDTRKALYLIIERVGDVHMAIDFAKEQHDKSLWDEFLKYAMDKPDFIIGLLRNSSGFIDPLQVIEKIPSNLKIPNLKSALIQIMTDCSVQLSLRKGCEKILQSDIWDTFAELNRAQNIGSKLTPSSICSLCEESISDTPDHIVLFLCSHFFHATCINANIMLISDTDDSESKRMKTAALDKSIDFIYNSKNVSQTMSIPAIYNGTESILVDTKSISCPICTS